MSVTITSKTNEKASLIGTRWQLDPAHTTVEFAVKHMMITTVRGRFGSVTGSIYVDPARPHRPEVNVTIDAASLDTREAKRDAHLKSADFLDAANHETLTFVGKRIEGDLARTFRLIGDLTIRGITREVVLDAEFEGHTKDPWGGERLGFSATTRINRKDFDLKWNVALETGGVLVGDEVRLTIDTQLVKEQAAAQAA
jgi:polyisoprenoid-binding protein YceI